MYSWSRFWTVNHRETASNYQLSRLRSGQDWNSNLRGGRRVCYHWRHCGSLHSFTKSMFVPQFAMADHITHKILKHDQPVLLSEKKSIHSPFLHIPEAVSKMRVSSSSLFLVYSPETPHTYFNYYALTSLNTIPLDITTSHSVISFRMNLKTHLFH